MNDTTIDSIGHSTEFGLAIRELRKELNQLRSSRDFFLSVYRSQYRLAQFSAKHIPSSIFTIDPENETTFLVSVEGFGSSVSSYVYLRELHSNGRTRYDTEINDHPNDEAIEATKNCLDAWQRWDAIQNKSNLAPMGSIPPERRTKPLTKIKAARALGQTGDKSSAVEWLSKCIADGIIRAEKMNRQSYVFDFDQFPTDQHGKLKATGGN